MCLIKQKIRWSVFFQHKQKMHTTKPAHIYVFPFRIKYLISGLWDIISQSGLPHHKEEEEAVRSVLGKPPLLMLASHVALNTTSRKYATKRTSLFLQVVNIEKPGNVAYNSTRQTGRAVLYQLRVPYHGTVFQDGAVQ